MDSSIKNGNRTADMNVSAVLFWCSRLAAPMVSRGPGGRPGPRMGFLDRREARYGRNSPGFRFK